MLGHTSGNADFDDPADSLPASDSGLPPPPSDAPAPAPPIRVASGHGVLQLLAAIVIVYVTTGGLLPSAPGGGDPANIPPPGRIWFATSFDPDTFDVRGLLTYVGADDTFFMVGQLTRSVAGRRLVIREYLDGELITVAWTLRTDEARIWGFSLGPLRGPGTWRYEIADIGGDILASGGIVARK